MLPQKTGRAVGLILLALLLGTPLPAQVANPVETGNPESGWSDPATLPASADTSAASATEPPPAFLAKPVSYRKDDVMSAAEGVFGKGTEGLAKIV